MPELRLETRKYEEEYLSIASSGSRPPGFDAPLHLPYTGAWGPGLAVLAKWNPVRAGIAYFVTPTVNQEDREGHRIDLHLPQKRDPSTQIDLDDLQDEVQDLVLRMRTSRSISCREGLANRLVELLSDAEEEDPESLGISPGSLRNFYNFLRAYPNVKCPTITLTPGCTIYASWRPGQNRLFAVDFLANEDVLFVVFRPNERHPERPIRLSGSVTMDVLKDTVEGCAVWEWISE
jgi:hypothetical protein